MRKLFMIILIGRGACENSDGILDSCFLDQKQGICLNENDYDKIHNTYGVKVNSLSDENTSLTCNKFNDYKFNISYSILSSDIKNIDCKSSNDLQEDKKKHSYIKPKPKSLLSFKINPKVVHHKDHDIKT